MSTHTAKKKEGEKEEEAEDCQAERSLYLHTSPCSLSLPSARFKCQIRNNIEAIAQRSSILCHIYDIMPNIFAYMGRKLPPHPPKLSLAEVSCHVCGLLMSASAATEAQEAASREETGRRLFSSRVKPFKMCCYDRAAAISSR